MARAATARIRELATLLDSEDPWRAKLRALLPHAAEEGKRLRALAADADFAKLSAAGCRVLSQALGRAGESAAFLDVLRRSQAAHPQDFDLCFRLAIKLEASDPPEWEQAIACGPGGYLRFEFPCRIDTQADAIEHACDRAPAVLDQIERARRAMRAVIHFLR